MGMSPPLNKSIKRPLNKSMQISSYNGDQELIRTIKQKQLELIDK